ncbi:MAG: 1-deoxy-D-xylulose 5-phosphate reductoisomerase [Myxococcales bacterium]|nr:1-deoxy-D-xylulose 5-phosphate reductoisomerase [Myxococcales bacterium]
MGCQAGGTGLARPYTGRVKRVALLGATGSIGRQAIEIVAAHPELELCAVASGSTLLDDVDAPLKQVGGDLTELLDRAQPDVVLNAVVGFAGIHATLWALEQGVDLALANKESLVAAGEQRCEHERGRRDRRDLARGQRGRVPEDRERGIAIAAIAAARILEVEPEDLQQVVKAFWRRHHTAGFDVLTEPVRDPISLIGKRKIGCGVSAQLCMSSHGVIERVEDVAREVRRERRAGRRGLAHHAPAQPRE